MVILCLECVWNVSALVVGCFMHHLFCILHRNRSSEGSSGHSQTLWPDNEPPTLFKILSRYTTDAQIQSLKAVSSLICGGTWEGILSMECTVGAFLTREQTDDPWTIAQVEDESVCSSVCVCSLYFSYKVLQKAKKWKKSWNVSANHVNRPFYFFTCWCWCWLVECWFTVIQSH